MKPEHCIIVCCHGIFTGKGSPSEARSWLLQPYQSDEEPRQYIAHCKAGIALAYQQERSCLIFSGGYTYAESPDISEARSYYQAATQAELFPPDFPSPILLEEYARDSFENILLSLLCFHDEFGYYPRSLSIVSWQFKSERLQLHCQALQLPSTMYNIIGVENPADMAKVEPAERRVREFFSADPFGLYSPLADKRQQRNPFSREIAYKNYAKTINLCNNKERTFPWNEDNTHNL